MLKKFFSSNKLPSSTERDNYLLEEYLQNASLSLVVAIKQLQYASAWLHKYNADSIDVDVLLETLKAHAEELEDLQQHYQ